jgi:hypothetical protein
MRDKPSRPSWVVVNVQSGIPVTAKFFADFSSATSYELGLRQRMNPDNDETGIFEVRTEGTVSYSVSEREAI